VTQPNLKIFFNAFKIPLGFSFNNISAICYLSEYVADHWIEDEFYGYQFLNGVNPNAITKCSELPKNFPVTEEMVKPFLEGSSLQSEMTKGNIFIYDQKKMEGLPVRDYEGKPLHVTPGLCLLYVNSKQNLVPIAIQLHQEPAEENPIFLPSDSETDWLLAKIFIKNADALNHQAVTHLMRTHFLAEVYIVAALRCLPEIHPIYKLLFPHFRYTLHINTGGRKSLFGPDGALHTSSLGYDGIIELMRRSLAQITYSSFFLPENITARGLDSIPNNYYRDDGLKLWNIISSFVKTMVEYYYPTDDDVRKDTELQEWISEIFTHGVLGNKESGFPTCFRTVEEVIRFITMFIFTVSGQHSAVNNPQYDYCSMMPNYSLLLRKPPPTSKGQSTKETILETLPNVGEAVGFATMAIVLTGNYADKVFLGNYPHERFDEPVPKKIIEEFQAKLANLTKEIEQRNSAAEPPYIYLDPSQMENSIAI
uniref:Lipoxygenase domain-containing protein n=1 Tax=Mola mola TaxID=94237 RepID=A0A3Q3WSI6_MOLML